MNANASSHPGYSWLSAPGASALSVLWLRKPPPGLFGGALLRVGTSPRLVVLLDHTGARVDQAVASRIGDDLLVTCHGGAASRRAIENELIAGGLSPCAPRGIWGETSPLQLALSDCLPRVHGRLGASLVLDSLAHGPERLINLLALPQHDRGSVVNALSQSRWLFHPPRVQLWGAVNTGKSSLLNALCGAELAATGDEPGLTRDVVEGRYEHEGLVVRLFDAPGQMDGAAGVDAAALELAEQWRRQADLVIHLRPGAKPVVAGSEWIISSRADENDDAQGVSVRQPQSLRALKDLILRHFVGELLSVRTDCRMALTPELLADLRRWAVGEISSASLHRWVAAE